MRADVCGQRPPRAPSDFGGLGARPPNACLRTVSKHIFVYVVIAIKRGEKAVGLSKERLAMTALNLFSVRLCRRRVMRTQADRPSPQRAQREMG